MTIRPGRWLLWAVAAVVVGLIAWSFRPQPVPVDFAAVRRGDLRVTIDEEGVTRVRERYTVSAPVAGRLQRVELDPGSTVVAHRTVLATFLPAAPSLLDARTRAEADARMKAAEALRDQARVTLNRTRDLAAFSRRELGRQREIAKAGGVTDERLAAIEQTARSNDAQVTADELALQRAEHELNAARIILQQILSPSAPAGGALTLRSPIDGVVLRVHQESEALVPAGTLLIDVGDPDHLEVVAELLSSDAVKVKPGYPVIIDGWGGDTTLHGRVRLVEPGGFTRISALGIDEQRVNVIIDFDTPPTGIRRTLGDGYRVDVSIVTWQRDGILKIPTSALFRVGSDWAVFAVRQGKAAQAIVKLGQRNATEAELLSGLAEGDRVIVHPGDAVAEGVSVTAR